ncbi:hypothetical protein AK88_01279 [Plasmodium fragile]|uniref:Uncharacterized protein n=1 Tax=Plasmodium fragile TaxID=5857 RepID=A0A0D9QQA9_PLAFR|nr:uncharacterized protein AK88_01279 [Plasmodium fragile]KJP88987.1 hypothetical protein AK88_01279 [Plasmodium fragile]
MVIGKILNERSCAKKWAHINVEKEIHTRVNDLLNRIVYGRNRGEHHSSDRIHTPDDSNAKATSKWRCYNKIAVDLLKEYVRAFHREKKKCHPIVYQEEKLHNGEKMEEGKTQRVNDTGECANGRSVDKGGDRSMLQLTQHKDKSDLRKKEQPSKYLTDNSNSRMNTIVNLDHLQYIWLKHTMIIFKLLIESNVKVEEKRKFGMTSTVLVLLKRTLRGMPRGCPANGRTRADNVLSWAYLLYKVNMVDKELIIQMCHFFQPQLKTLTSINKFHLLSCMSSFHSLSKRFLRVENYLQGYFYNLLKMVDKHVQEGSEAAYTPAGFVQRRDEAAVTTAAAPTSHQFLCPSELCQVLFKRKKHLTHLDRTILKNVLNRQVVNYGKVPPSCFKFILKTGDRDMQRFLFERIIEHVELYEQAELNHVLGSFVKKEGMRRKLQGKLAKGEELHQAAEQDEDFSTLMHILLEADLHNMNLKHVFYLYVYINRLLKKELRKTMWGRKGKAIQEEHCLSRITTPEGEAQTNYTQNGHTKRGQEVDTNPFHSFEQICEAEDYHEGAVLYDGDPHGGNISLMNQVNEKIILILEKKIYYIKMNNLITLMYNTCPIISPKQIAFLEVCFSHLVEEKYLTFNLAQVYHSLYKRFVHSGMCMSPQYSIHVSREKWLHDARIANGENAKWIPAVRSQYEQKMEKIFSYLKERYYLKREQDMGDISTCTILLNICQKFLLNLLLYSFHREHLSGYGHLRCGGAAAVLDLIQHICTHLHFVIVSTRGGMEEEGVKDDCDGDRYDDEEERRPLRRKQFELALVYGRNIVSHMDAYVDSVERAFQLCSNSEDGIPLGHLITAPPGLSKINNSGGKPMLGAITPNAVPLCSDQDLQHDPINIQNVRHLMHYVTYVCSCIRERMDKFQGEKICGKGQKQREVDGKTWSGVTTPFHHQRVHKIEKNMICV